MVTSKLKQHQVVGGVLFHPHCLTGLRITARANENGEIFEMTGINILRYHMRIGNNMSPVPDDKTGAQKPGRRAPCLFYGADTDNAGTVRSTVSGNAA